MSWRQRLGMPVLYVALLLSAIAVAWSKQQVRSLEAQRQELAGERDRLGSEFNQLRLERATFASHARIEREAVETLQMQDPDDYAIVLVPAHTR